MYAEKSILTVEVSKHWVFDKKFTPETTVPQTFFTHGTLSFIRHTLWHTSE
jgi:hypothetical protein